MNIREAPKSRYAVGVFGSRSIFDERAYKIIDETIKNINKYVNVTHIVTAQEPKGVCKIAQTFAKRNSYCLELHFINPKKYGTGIFHERSVDIINASDYILLIHDGESQGTINEWEITELLKKKHNCEQISASEKQDKVAEIKIVNKQKVQEYWQQDDGFNEWMQELKEIYDPEIVEQCGESHWRTFYEKGMSAEDTIQELQDEI